MSAQNAARIKPQGYIPRTNRQGTHAIINTLKYQGRSYDCSPRQLGYLFSTGNHPNFEIVEMGPPQIFYDGNGMAKPTGSSWVVGRFQKGINGFPSSPVAWTPVGFSQKPIAASGPIAWLSSQFGDERCMENIVGCRGEEGTRDIIATHVSKSADRRLIIVNPDNWQGQTGADARGQLIEEIEKTDLTDVERFELSSDGKTLTLTYGKLVGYDGQPLQKKIDISSLKLDPKGVYSNPDDAELSVRLIALDEHTDFECTSRERVTIMHNQAIVPVDSERGEVARATRRDKNTVDIIIDRPVKVDVKGTTVTGYSLADGKIRIRVGTIGFDELKEIAVDSEENLRSNALFLEQSKPIQSAMLKAFHSAHSIEVEDANPTKIRKLLKDAGMPKEVIRAALEAYREAFSVENFEQDRPINVRKRYALQFYRSRESRFTDALATPLEAGEAVVATKVLCGAKVVALNDRNGVKKGDSVIVPFNFDPTEGTGDYDSLVLDEHRPNAINRIIFGDPCGTAIAPQHLVDPTVMGTEMMSAIWPKVDQLGFFGPNMLASAGFPHGAIFSDPRNNPWFLRFFGGISHSIFDGKSDAGSRAYFLTGLRMTSLMQTGAAMVTGPNTDTANPVREGRLFNVRTPGRRSVIKTAIPGFYIPVIEDAWSSLMEAHWFGLKTETVVDPFSVGGGLDSYPTALVTQRGVRWNAGLMVHLVIGSETMSEDMTRGSRAYRLAYKAANKVLGPNSRLNIFRTQGGVMLASAGDAESDELQARLTESLNPKRPVVTAWKRDEAREWLNVGTWYYVALARLVFFLTAPILVITPLLTLPVTGGLAFLFACLANTVFGWPFWAMQMAKVGVNPNTIIGLSPVHLFWGDMGMRTMMKSGFDIERMGVGRFRISDRSVGNRLPPKDKRVAFWIGAVAPATFGTALLGLTYFLSIGISFSSLAIAGAPFILGIGLSQIASRGLKKIMPNPNSRSFLKSLALKTAAVAPLVLGLGGTVLASSSLVTFAIPISLAIMAGFWSIYMGLNILNEFRIYHKEQAKAPNMPAPNPRSIPGHKVDTWRNTLLEVCGISPSDFLIDEFTSMDNPEMSPYFLWERINGRPLAEAGLPNFGPLKDLLVKHSILTVGGTVVQHYRNRTELEAAIASEGLSESAFYAKYGTDVSTLHATLLEYRGIHTGLLDKGYDPLAGLNNLVSGEGTRVIDLYEEFRDIHTPTLVDAESVTVRFAKKSIPFLWVFNPLFWGELISQSRSREKRIGRLVALTKETRKTLHLTKTSELEAKQYDRIKELNRLVLEEIFPVHCPKRDGNKLSFVAAILDGLTGRGMS